MKKMRSPWLPVLALAALPLPTALAGQGDPVLTWNGEIRPRVESREPVDGRWDYLTSMRTRISADVRMEDGLGLFFQLQDVRIWGEELSVRDRSADNMDFHQAYLEVAELPALGGMIRAGRQEVGVAENRLLGAPDWGQGGQTFDGARWIRPTGDGRLELIFLRTRENSTPPHEAGADILAAWFELPGAAGGTTHLYLIHNRAGGALETGQSSLGGIWRGELSPFSLLFQGIYQAGTRKGVEVEASLLSAQGRLDVLNGSGSVSLWYDRLSGDEDPDDEQDRAFTTLLGARNRFYGRADYFLDIPRDTRSLGLQDAALKLAWKPRQDLDLNLDLHAFRTAERGGLTSRRLGEELDGWIRLEAGRFLVVQAGYALTRAGPGMEELDLLRGTGHFGYFMTSVRF